MGETRDIGHRIELVPMDAHFQDITIALYRQMQDKGPAYRVHTYSRKEGVRDRMASIVRAMQVLGGMEKTADDLLYFPCRAAHTLAVKRVFLEACKADPASEITVRPLKIEDRKSGLTVCAHRLDDSAYRIQAEGQDADRRIAVIINGLRKLGEMDASGEDGVCFECHMAHDALVGLLLVRAPNVRAVLREAEMIAARGVLAAPSAQKR